MLSSTTMCVYNACMRDVSPLQAIIVDVMRESDKAKLGAAMKWSRKKFSVFKTDERRKVNVVASFGERE